MIEDIANEIKQYNSINKGKTPSYITVNESDSKRLITAMFKAKLIPNKEPTKKLTLFGLRIIRTGDIQRDVCNNGGVVNLNSYLFGK